MVEKTTIFRILRYKPGTIDPPRFQDFGIAVRPGMTVLDGLDEIRLTRDETLMYRHCCHHASCGTCACMINGAPGLACTTRITGLKTEVITLAPLGNHPCLGDLAVDVAGFFQQIDAHWTNHRPCRDASAERTPQGVDQLQRFENCIECGCCVAACPVVSNPPRFMGPAALAALNNERQHRPASQKLLLEIAAGPHGADQCRRHLACSRVCPAAVYPARHIADLQREINKQK
jgi:succinate dehydrogenase / fumarate reductase iron-sulfur subunit